jgi:hypothetical protein
MDRRLSMPQITIATHHGDAVLVAMVTTKMAKEAVAQSTDF